MQKLFITLLLSLCLYPLSAQRMVEHLGISQTNVDLSNSTVLGKIELAPTQAGKVIVHFDGMCVSSPGDRIVLAASNSTSWGVNDGNVGLEAVDSDLNRNNFSHTRVYDVTPGTHSFYAIGHNYIETEGSNKASIYGMLTVEFVPTSAGIVAHRGIIKTNQDLSNSTVLEKITIDPTVPGKVVVRFDGNCVSSPGDRIVLAANDAASWEVNDGNVGVEARNADQNQTSFSHTRMYDVNAGSYTYYAVAHNYVETDGSGIASIYGSLTVEFIPTSAYIQHKGIIKTNLDLSTSTILEQVSITHRVRGKAIVTFDGVCSTSPGDRIILAASDDGNWAVNDGNVGVEGMDADLNSQPFSHTRVYEVEPGTQTFSAVAHNYVETEGNGTASIYGSLTVIFVPDNTTGLFASSDVSALKAYPNPTQGVVHLDLPAMPAGQAQTITVLGASGQIYKQEVLAPSPSRIDLDGLPAGLYFIQVRNKDANTLQQARVVKLGE
ncbi:MAG: T9SS type A sorting domain-containing protein [Bacteroidota bacterium]